LKHHGNLSPKENDHDLRREIVHTLGILGVFSTGMQQVNNLSLQTTKDFYNEKKQIEL
jgi:hypothetical protein